MTSKRVAVIPGDGIGPEVTSAAITVVEATGAPVEFEEFGINSGRWHRGEELIGDEELGRLDTSAGILLGAVGDPAVPSGVLERDILLRLRFRYDLGVNLRPVRLLPGARSPLRAANADSVDMVFVRENTEGPYAGTGGSFRADTPDELALQDSVNTRRAVTRVVRYAFELAARRRGHLTWIHKTNVLTHAGRLWAKVVEEQHQRFPQVEVAYQHADATCIHLVQDPGRFDVAVTDNLFGDLVTDLGGAVAGGIGFLPSANIAPDNQHPGLFEPVHGSAPDIAGRGVANPTGSILSAALLLREIGFEEQANAIEKAVHAAGTAGRLVGKTREISSAVVEHLTR
ncbi:3-isopropylmalate dehydrogenase [Actinoalloteichus spitiensis]|uniref:3-isopropylmalate dehydrogenase n=1 Tax=Actinoalloteichus spitiensis TaxID=252394 RepID=UPI0012F62D55|nr:3-isopropylmalate dehydrogenase [Actinoalloteichus spitiensis]